MGEKGRTDNNELQGMPKPEKGVQSMAEETHTVHIRNIPHELYERMWNLRKFYQAKSWTDLMDKITQEYEIELKETEWL